MNDWKIFIIIFTCLLMPIFGGYQSADAQENLAQQAYAIFQQNCLNCHGEHGAFTEKIIIEHTALIETGAVVPGKPIASELYTRLLTNDPAKRMPLGQPQLPADAILTIGNWIQAGARRAYRCHPHSRYGETCYPVFGNVELHASCKLKYAVEG